MSSGSKLLMVMVLGLASCASTASQETMEVELDDVVEGVVTEARCYFATGATGGEHQLCSFIGFHAELPTGLLTDSGDFVYLTSVPSTLADQATKRLRVEGALARDGHVLAPKRIWVESGGGWQLVDAEPVASRAEGR